MTGWSERSVSLRVSGVVRRQAHDLAELFKGGDRGDGHDYIQLEE